MLTVLGLVLSWVLSATSTPPQTGPGRLFEYCQHETFNATCPEGQVIMMTSAQYGRMRVARCLHTDYRKGCGGNVLGLMDERCSGRQSCRISIPDPIMFAAQPCRSDLMVYLEASYDCVPVINPLVTKKVYCSQKIEISNMTEGYIASSVTTATTLGSRLCPWEIVADPGRTINVSLFDFSVRRQLSTSTSLTAAQSGSSRKPDRPRACPIYARLEEGDRSHSVQFCPDDTQQRRRWLYTTNSNVLRIQINLSKQNPDNVSFILHFSVTGCPNIVPPPGAHVIRTEVSLTVSCNHTKETWHLTCKGNDWVGAYHNCSSAHNSPGAKRGDEEEQGFPLGLLIAIAIGVVVGVVLGFVFLIAIFVCRKRQRQETKHDSGNPLMGGQPVDPDQNIYRLVEVRPPPMMCDCQFTPGTDHKSMASIDNTLLMQPPGECIYRTGPRVDPGECPYQSREGDTYQPQNVSPLKTCDIISDIHVPDNFQCCEGPEWYTAAAKQQYLRSQSDTYPRIPPFPGFNRGERGTMPRNQMPSCDSGNATDVSDASTAPSNTTSFQPPT